MSVLPLLRLSSPLSPYTAILCVVTQRFSPLQGDTKNSRVADYRLIELELRKPKRYLDNRLCRIGPGHLLEFIVSALGKMKIMQIGDVGKPKKREKK